MTKSLLDSVADSTSHRDRDRFHRSIASLIAEYLQTESVSLYHLVDDGGVVRLIPEAAANAEAGDVTGINFALQLSVEALAN